MNDSPVQLAPDENPVVAVGSRPLTKMTKLNYFLRWLLSGVICFAPSADLVWAQRGGQEPLSAEQVRRAIRQGREYLLNELPKTRLEMSNYQGGVTALCTLALINAGVSPSHEKIQQALKFLRTIEPEKTYVVALQTMVFSVAQPRRDLPLIQRNVDWLERTQLTQGELAGSWSYPHGGRLLSSDNSNSQFAVLALHEAERVGAKVDATTWQLAANYWKEAQRPDGSWGYQRGQKGSGSMTCAGIGAMVICSGKVAPESAKIEAGVIRCCQPADENDALERALTWLGRNFSVHRNPGSQRTAAHWHYYYLYGLERVGRLTARRFIGKHDWYREGAELLIARQDKFSHHWESSGFAEKEPHIATALALLFLSKGRRPVLLAKLQYDSVTADQRPLSNDWNNHRSDVANLTAYTEKLWGLDLTWQVIKPVDASVDDLLQAPVLFMSGNERPQLEGVASKMRDYLDRGGFLFAEECCTSGDFEEGFRDFLNKVFPEGEYQLRRAGPEHPLWRVEEVVRPDSPYVGRLWTVEYGCRTCVVLSEVDLSCYWELRAQSRRRDLPEVVQRRINDAMSIGVNVLAYATNREPKGKEATFPLASAPDLDALGQRGVIRVAKLQHGGGCNDAPGALVNLLRAAGQGELRLRIDASEFQLRANDPSLPLFHLAFMHGRQDFRLTPDEQVALREFLLNGGTLMADAICASKDFADAFRRELALVLPDVRLERVPIDHPLFSEAAGGFDIRQVERRDPAGRGGANQPLRTRVLKVEPELEAMEIDGRLAVIFSPYDISCALEQHEALQCRGYTQRDAARIGLNVLMYSLTPDAEN